MFPYNPKIKCHSPHWSIKLLLTQKVSLAKVKDWNDYNFCLIKSVWSAEKFLKKKWWILHAGLGKLMKKILRMKPQIQEKSSWFHFHYTPACSAIIMQWLLTDSGLVEMSHPPYSLSLAPSDHFLTPEVETVLIGGVWLCRNQDVHTTKLNTVILYASSDCFSSF